MGNLTKLHTYVLWEETQKALVWNQTQILLL